MMYCLSIGTKNFQQAFAALENQEMAEIRLDLTQFSKPEIQQLCQKHNKLIFSFRRDLFSDDNNRLDHLKFAITKGARWVDIDIENELYFLENMHETITKTSDVNLILSYHNYEQVPTNKFLYDIIIKASVYQPSLIKIACMSQGDRDNRRLLAFNRDFENILAFGMGEKGKYTRVQCLREGAPFSYIAMEGQATAAGQMTKIEMDLLINNAY